MPAWDEAPAFFYTSESMKSRVVKNHSSAFSFHQGRRWVPGRKQICSFPKREISLLNSNLSERRIEMRKSCNKFLLFLAIGAFFAGGCAKHDMVKKDEMVPETKTAKSADTSTVNPWPSDTAIKEQPLKEQPIKEAPFKDLPGGDIAKSASVVIRPEAALEKIFFDFDSYTRTTIARDTLAKNSEVMKKKAGVKIRIEGHCDERGSDEYNLALGEKRAKSAMQYLQTMGVPAERLAVISYGEEKPADPGHGESAWTKNRRDEFFLISK